MSHSQATSEENGDAFWDSSKGLSSGSEAEDVFAVVGSSQDGVAASSDSTTNFDSFAMTSLQSTAAAILAVQQLHPLSQYNFEQDGHVYASSGITSGSESEAGLSRQASPPSSRRASHSQGKSNGTTNGPEKLHSERHMWSSEETQCLVDGCNKHGIGNWKAILSDEQFSKSFVGRTPGDLKDRFRTYFPDAYHELYPNAKTHTSRAVRSKAPDGTSIFGKGKTKERRPFTPAEDEVLKRGYQKFGSHWAVIAKEPVFEGKRKSTDLRDRFRNAFPNLYEQAGYKPRAKSNKKERRQSSAGSFSGPSDHPSVMLNSDPSDHAERPAPPARSETSTSAHSQAVSEHSEEDESDYHDSHFRDLSEGSFAALGGDVALPTANSSDMLRSQSHDLTASVQAFAKHAHEQHPSNVTSGTTSPTGAANTSAAASTSKHPLRRSHSSKRAQTKVQSLEQAVKNASIKCNKEALLASHQHVHQQHQQQRHQQQPQQFQQDNAMVGVWPDRFAWEQNASSTDAGDLADMDLDQMGEMINAHSAAQLLESASVGSAPSSATLASSTSTAAPLGLEDNANVNVNASNALLANLYRELGLYGQNTPSAARSVAVDSFQDLLDPLGPSNGVVGSQWNTANNTSTFLPWTPVSSTAAPQQEVSSPATAQRRDHEHNQWAGDLLHRGNFTSIEDWNPDAFVNMANMQLNMTALTPQPRSAESERAVALPPATVQRSSSQSLASAHRPTLPVSAQSLSMPSVHELLSKSSATRRVSNPPRLGDEGTLSESLLQSAYRTPYPYPADDLSLVNSNLAGNITLFPSLVANDGQTSDGLISGSGLSRRRRSTDTLRENVYQAGAAQAWRNPMEALPAEQAAIVAGMSEDAETEQQRVGSVSQRAGEQRAPSVPSADDHDAPNRAASVGNLDLQGSVRDSGMYAESLPDPSTHDSFGDAHAGTTTFPIAQQMQMSFDDMDLPSFLNRSPNFAHVNASAVNTNMFSSPRLSSLVQDNTNWLKVAGATMRGQRDGGDVPRSSGVGSSNSTNAPISHEFSNDVASNNGVTHFSASFSDAGALDRLEHLYLEGLHTPGSPALFGLAGGGTTASASSYSASGTAGQSNGSQRFANNTNGLFVPFERTFGGSNVGVGGGDAGSGYESV